MLVYIEFVSRRPGVSLEAFHKVAAIGQYGWAKEWAEDDQLLLNLGRTWRIGPEPEYMSVWYSPRSGLERIDEWERTFRAGEADHVEEPFKIAARIDVAGCYEPLLEPTGGTGERYYVERFEPTAPADTVAEHFQARVTRHTDLRLHLLATRIGALGPHPRGIAVWGLRTWSDLDPVCRDLDDPDAPTGEVQGALMSTFGSETL